jgi:hypothetical protein
MERAPRRLTLRRPRQSVKPGCPSAPHLAGERTATLPEGLRTRCNGGRIRHSCGGIAAAVRPRSLYRIGMFFIFINFQHKSPGLLLPRLALRPAPAGERALAPARAVQVGMDGSPPAHTRARRAQPSGKCARPAARFAGTRQLATRLHLLRGACHRDAAAEYQKPAASRSFKGSRWPVHSTHGADAAGRATQGAPPNSPAAALKKTPTSL